MFLVLSVWCKGESTKLQESSRKEAESLGESCLDEGLAEGFPLSLSLFPPTQGVLVLYGACLIREEPPYKRLVKAQSEEGGVRQF